jgi:UDP-N-acetylmuramate dehydrogenase
VLEYNKSLIKHTSFKTSGTAKIFFTPNTIKDLQNFLKQNKQPVLFLGLGSNLLIHHFKGVVIYTIKLNKISIDDNTISALCGSTLAKVSRFAKQNNLEGLAFFSGIPGTIGGALAMNAGAFGYETWDYITKITTIDNQGNLHLREKKDWQIKYREVIGCNDEYFIQATFDLSGVREKESIKPLLLKRNETQPIGQASCGSVFKNPPNQYAAKIIESLDLKGFCIGDACVSEKHANFIINKKNASSVEVSNLIKHIQKLAKIKLDVNLETEVKII